LFLVLFSFPAFAVEKDKSAEQAANEILMREVSIIGSKYKVKDIAGSAAFLDVQEIREHSVDDVNRILRRVPGVNLREEDGAGLFPNISLRGVDSARTSKVTVMEDGILMAPAPYSAPSAYYSPTTGRMSGIEVLKGSSQVKYGPHTTGGAINFLSTPIPTAEKIYSKMTFGTYNEIRNHFYFGNTQQTEDGKIGYLIEYYTRSNTGFKDMDVNPASMRGEPNTGFDKQEPMVKLFWEPKSALYQRFEGKFGYTNLDANETYLGLSTADFEANPYRRYAASRFDEIESHQFRNHIRHFLELDSDTSLVTTLYGNTFHRNWQKLNKITPSGGSSTNLSEALTSSGGLAVINGTAAGTLELKNNNRGYYMYGLQSTLNHKLKKDGVEHNIEVGLRLHYDQVRRKQWEEDFTQDANGNVTAVSVDPRGSAGNKLQKTFATTVHASDAMKFGKFTFTPGVRVETISQEYCDDDTNCGNDTMEQEGTYSVIVGGASLKYDMYDSGGEDFDLFGGVFRGFSPVDPINRLKNGLKEETSVGVELGARYKDAPKALSTEAVLFYTRISDLVVNSSVGGTGTGTAANLGLAQTLGLELQANYDPGLANGWVVQTPMYMSATYTNAIFMSSVGSTDQESIFAGALHGNQLPYIPEISVSWGFGAIYKKMSANIDSNFVSSAYADGSNNACVCSGKTDGSAGANERFGKIDSRIVVDGSIGYQYSKKVRMFANIRNLFNTAYMVSRQPHGPRPGLPMTVMGGLEFTL
jgi:Fe(3+) dicitrate transport protein